MPSAFKKPCALLCKESSVNKNMNTLFTNPGQAFNLNSFNFCIGIIAEISLKVNGILLLCASLRLLCVLCVTIFFNRRVR